MAMQVGGSKKPYNEINITPFVDVVLVLLIIFMVITPRVVHEMSANMPSQHQPVKRPKTPSTQLVVAAYDNGDLALNTRVMGRESLMFRMVSPWTSRAR